MAREDALVALVNDQMKVVHFHGIAVPVAPEKLDRPPAAACPLRDRA